MISVFTEWSALTSSLFPSQNDPCFHRTISIISNLFPSQNDPCFHTTINIVSINLFPSQNDQRFHRMISIISINLFPSWKDQKGQNNQHYKESLLVTEWSVVACNLFKSQNDHFCIYTFIIVIFTDWSVLCSQNDHCHNYVTSFNHRMSSVLSNIFQSQNDLWYNFFPSQNDLWYNITSFSHRMICDIM